VLAAGLEGLLVAAVDGEVGVEVGRLRGGSAGREGSRCGGRCAAYVKVGLTLDGLVVCALSRVLFVFIVLRELVFDRDGGIPEWLVKDK